jgi:hypothetical protein
MVSTIKLLDLLCGIDTVIYKSCDSSTFDGSLSSNDKLAGSFNASYVLTILDMVLTQYDYEIIH